MNGLDNGSPETSSSSTTSPKAQVYYVQSPSRDSQDDADKSLISSMQNTPIDSPSHSSSYGRHSSRESSSSRLSVNWYRRRSSKGWQQCPVIQEDNHHIDPAYSRACLFFIALFAFGALFCFIMWGASTPYQPHITIKALRVHNFYFGQGADRTGVPTKLLTVNCSVTMAIHNPATFFGIYVSSNPVNLFFSDIKVATGKLDKYYQPKESQRDMSVNLDGRRVPLYGAGVALVESDGRDGVPLKLDFEILSKGYIVGKLVKTKHRKHVSCSFFISSRSMNEVKFKQDSCSFD
ncbi:hypothetical protein K7X08_011787 [Anisodus acutangulus]|uniref:Late embryogenesis abundant protein LEA-2 subgroup domain-containing protein n=1 Tax=Anisodus acutangulus TaxID=402998 RepID=A0A9Q1MNF5_9SOLA|nr:hypothetical protein K7X08_011787 [Anisodus acutangulus]